VRFGNWPYERDLAAVIFDPLFMPIPIGGNTWRTYFRGDSADKTHQAHIEHCLKVLAPGATLAGSDEPQLFHTHSRVATQFRSGECCSPATRRMHAAQLSVTA
jgi:hypothetical protein